MIVEIVEIKKERDRILLLCWRLEIEPGSKESSAINRRSNSIIHGHRKIELEGTKKLEKIGKDLKINVQNTIEG
jgi:hypothetical protein